MITISSPHRNDGTSSRKRAQWGWYWFDFGNSAYFQGTVVGGAEGSRLWGLSLGIAMIFVALLTPILGTVADYAASKISGFLGFMAAFLIYNDGILMALNFVGLVGLNDVFPALLKGRRAKIQFVIGKPFGPFRVTGRGREKRELLDEIGHEIMRHIAELIPPERRGCYSDDPVIREAARGTEIYPWAEKVEGQVVGQVH